MLSIGWELRRIRQWRMPCFPANKPQDPELSRVDTHALELDSDLDEVARHVTLVSLKHYHTRGQNLHVVDTQKPNTWRSTRLGELSQWRLMQG